MMSNGFIVSADFQKKHDDDIAETDLHIEDLRSGNNDDDTILQIYITENGSILSFTRPNALAFAEAFQEILERYRKTEDV